MAKKFKSQYKNRPTKSSRETEEFGGGKKGLIICENCKVFYYKKSWHHDADAFIAKREDKDLPVNFTACPACKIIASHQYEGKILIKNIPEKVKFELLGLIKGFCERAYSRDPLDRLIEIKDGGADLVVTLTENELTNKLTNKIKETFKKVKKKIVFSSEPSDVALAVIEFFE